MFNSISDGVFTVDRNFVITSFNPAAERITGFSANEAVGRRCYEVFRTEVCHRQCALREALTSEAPVECAMVHIISHSGLEKPIVVNATVLREEGEIIGAVEFFRDPATLAESQQLFGQQNALADIVTGSGAMRRIIDTLPNIARSDCSVLVVGPSGSGKELIAQAIHSLSPRRYGSYVKINCAALPSTLLESELFGYVRGAFTDARQDKPGHFALANGGTLLLDEISEMDVSLQVKLLRVLNNGEYQPLGSTRTLQTDARVLAATNADLGELIGQGRFRSDLFFRINVVTVELPSLSARPEDIPLLANHFLGRFANRTGKPIRAVSAAALRLLCAHAYPGNVRELENAIEHAFVMCDGDVVLPEHLPRSLVEAVQRGETAPAHEPASERALIRQALDRHAGNRARAASDLGMHRTTLWRKLKTHGLES
jgi:PAS domain S-box-containing protein